MHSPPASSWRNFTRDQSGGARPAQEAWEWLNEDLTQVEWCLQGVSYPLRPLPKSPHTSLSLHPLPAFNVQAQEAKDSFRRLYLVKPTITVSDFTVKTLPWLH